MDGIRSDADTKGTGPRLSRGYPFPQLALWKLLFRIKSRGIGGRGGRSFGIRADVVPVGHGG